MQKKIGMLVILSLSIATVAMGTTGLSLVSPVFAGGDHHDHGEKKCKDNGDNNCNDTHKTQKIKAKNECEIENENKDHSHDNENLNELTCANEAQNLKTLNKFLDRPMICKSIGQRSKSRFAKASWLDFLLATPRQEGVRRSRKTISCGRCCCYY